MELQMQQTFVNQIRDLHQPSTTNPMYNINTKLFHGPDVSCSTSTCHPAFNSPFSEFPMSWVPYPVFYFEAAAFRRRTCSLSQNFVMNLLDSKQHLLTFFTRVGVSRLGKSLSISLWKKCPNGPPYTKPYSCTPTSKTVATLTSSDRHSGRRSYSCMQLPLCFQR